MEASDAIKTYAEEKSEKLKKYFDGKIIVDWNFEVDAHKHHIAHVHLLGNHIDYFGEAVTEELHGSIDQAIDKAERQIKKKKEQLKDNKHA